MLLCLQNIGGKQKIIALFNTFVNTNRLIGFAPSYQEGLGEVFLPLSPPHGNHT